MLSIHSIPALPKLPGTLLSNKPPITAYLGKGPTLKARRVGGRRPSCPKAAWLANVIIWRLEAFWRVTFTHRLGTPLQIGLPKGFATSKVSASVRSCGSPEPGDLEVWRLGDLQFAHFRTSGSTPNPQAINPNHELRGTGR